eukprot:gene10388-biopygen728
MLLRRRWTISQLNSARSWRRPDAAICGPVRKYNWRFSSVGD